MTDDLEARPGVAAEHAGLGNDVGQEIVGPDNTKSFLLDLGDDRLQQPVVPQDAPEHPTHGSNGS